MSISGMGVLADLAVQRINPENSRVLAEKPIDPRYGEIVERSLRKPAAKLIQKSYVECISESLTEWASRNLGKNVEYTAVIESYKEKCRQAGRNPDAIPVSRLRSCITRLIIKQSFSARSFRNSDPRYEKALQEALGARKTVYLTRKELTELYKRKCGEKGIDPDYMPEGTVKSRLNHLITETNRKRKREV